MTLAKSDESACSTSCLHVCTIVCLHLYIMTSRTSDQESASQEVSCASRGKRFLRICVGETHLDLLPVLL